MKRKLTWVLGSSVTLIASAALALWIARWHEEAVLWSRLSALQTVHYHLAHRGAEYASVLLEAQILDSSTKLEELLSDPLRPWLPLPPRGPYEPIPVWRQPSRRERLDVVIKARLRFQTEIGVTNCQAQTLLFQRLVVLASEKRRETERDSQPTPGGDSQPARCGSRTPQE